MLNSAGAIYLRSRIDSLDSAYAQLERHEARNEGRAWQWPTIGPDVGEDDIAASS